MALMKTLWILQQEAMAPEGQRHYGVEYRGRAVVFVKTREHAESIADILNRLHFTPAGMKFKFCFGPDHNLATALPSPPLWGSQVNQLPLLTQW